MVWRFVKNVVGHSRLELLTFTQRNTKYKTFSTQMFSSNIPAEVQGLFVLFAAGALVSFVGFVEPFFSTDGTEVGCAKTQGLVLRENEITQTNKFTYSTL